MRKKAQFFSIMMVIVFLIVMFTALAVISGRSGNKEEYVGQRQQQIFEAYNEAEQGLFLFDTILITSSKLAIYSFEDNGHFTELGNHVYNYWKTPTKQYVPTETPVNDKLTGFISPIVNSYIRSTIQFFPSDFYIDFNSGLVTVRKLWPDVIKKDNIAYWVHTRSAEKIIDFNYTEITGFIKEIDDECGGYDYEADYTLSLSDCVSHKINANPKIKAVTDCESGDRKALYQFAEEYNRCAASLDSECQCNLTNVNGISIEQGVARIGESAILLHKPYAGILQNNIMKTETVLQAAQTQLPECRVNLRTYNLCYDHNKSVLIINNVRPILTKFATFVEDRVPPPVIQASTAGNILSWNASTASDVKRYRIYAVQKGNPFVADEFISVERTDAQFMNSFRNVNSNFIYFFPNDLAGFDVKVVAEDLSGNFVAP